MARANRAFHSAIHASARNRYLTQSIKTLHEAMALLGPTTLARSDRAAQSLDEHQAIVDAIARHDAAAAEDLARQHVRAAFAERLRLNARRIAEREPGASDEV